MIINRNKVSLTLGTIQVCPRGESELSRYMVQNKIPVDAMVDIDLDFKKEDVDVAKFIELFKGSKEPMRVVRSFFANTRLQRFLEKGWQFSRNGRHYKEFYASAGEYRSAGVTLCDEQFANQIEDWWTCGFADKLKSILPLSKYNVYLARMDCTSKPWDVHFPNNGYMGLIKEINPRNAIVLKDAEYGDEAEYDHVYTDYISREKLAIDEKITDGFCLYIVNDLGLSDRQRSKLMKELKNHTINMPGFKMVVMPILKTSMLQFIADNKASFYISDFWGDCRDVREAQIITFGSAFKWAKAFAHLEEYCDAYEAYGHRCSVSVMEHKKRASVPYQMTQALSLDAAGVRDALNREKAIFDTYATNPSKLMGGVMGKAVELYPALYQTQYFAETVQSAWKSKRWQTAGGRFHDVGFYAFCCPDPIAVLQYVLGLPITGYLKKGNMRCRFFEAGKVILAARNPFLDPAFNIKKNAEIESKYAGFYATNALFHSIHDVGMRLSQMDYDGDKMFVTDDEWFIGRAMHAIMNIRWKDQSGNEHIGGRCLYYDAKSKAAEYSAENFKKQLRWLEPAQVGLIVNSITVEYAKKDVDYERIAIKTECGNTCVDNAKNGGENNPVVMGWIEKEATNRRKGHGDYLPLFHAYAKSSAMIPASFQNAARGHKFCPHSGIDQYSQLFMATTTSEVALPASEQFSMYQLMNKDAWFGNITGLVRNGKNVMADYDDDGHFNKLAIMNAREHSMMDKADVAVQQSWAEEATEFIRQSVFAYGSEHGNHSEAETINALVLGIYKGKEERNMQLQRVLWTCFGKELLENLANNTKVELSEEEFEQFLMETSEMMESDESFAD